MSYQQFLDDDGNTYGSFETFYDDDDNGRNFDASGESVKPGWYWWACFPGCLPDSEPAGPFATKAEAISDALDQ